MVFEHRRDYESQWAALVSIAGKIGGTPHTLLSWAQDLGQPPIQRSARTKLSDFT